MKAYFDDYFDMVYFINISSRTDKYENTMNMFSKLNITKYKHIVPITDKSMLVDNFLPPTALSCKLAHMACYKDAIDNNYEHICIFEDDICFNISDPKIEENIEYHLEYCFTFLKNFKWNLFHFDNITYAVKKNNIMKKYRRYSSISMTNIDKIAGKTFSHSYALSREGCIRMYKHHLSNKLWNDQSIMSCELNDKYIYKLGIFDQILDCPSDQFWNNA